MRPSTILSLDLHGLFRQLEVSIVASVMSITHALLKADTETLLTQWGLAFTNNCGSEIGDHGGTCITCCLDHLHHIAGWTCNFARLNHVNSDWDYKNPTWVWGWDRKIRPEDHRGLPSDDKRWLRGVDFSITLIMVSFSCSPLTIAYYIGNHEKGFKNPEYSEMPHGDVILTLQWRHGSTCGQGDCSFFIFPTGWYGYVR